MEKVNGGNIHSYPVWVYFYFVFMSDCTNKIYHEFHVQSLKLYVHLKNRRDTIRL